MKCCVGAKLGLYSVMPAWRAALSLQKKVRTHPGAQVKPLTQTEAQRALLGCPVVPGLIALSAGATASCARGGEEIARCGGRSGDAYSGLWFYLFI